MCEMWRFYASLQANLWVKRQTPLSGLQEELLQRQGLGTSLYRQLEIRDIGN